MTPSDADTPLTREERDRLEELARKATPGPWHAGDRGVGWEVHVLPHPEASCWAQLPDGTWPVDASITTGPKDLFSQHDAALIVAAVNYVRAALSQPEAPAYEVRQHLGTSTPFGPPPPVADPFHDRLVSQPEAGIDVAKVLAETLHEMECRRRHPHPWDHSYSMMARQLVRALRDEPRRA